ncbi:hypothetical protein KI387_028943, partial [Taxus chinensis]
MDMWVEIKNEALGDWEEEALVNWEVDGLAIEAMMALAIEEVGAEKVATTSVDGVVGEGEVKKVVDALT